MQEQDSVCTIIVTYNRKKLLLECLKGLLQQTTPIESIYLIDNASTDGTDILLFNHDYIDKIPSKNLDKPWERNSIVSNLTNGESVRFHYVRMPFNTGGAGGFHEGLKRAYEKGGTWFWLMDDDVEPSADALKKMLHYKSFSGCIHPIKKYTDGHVFAWNGYICDKIGVIVRQKENFKDKGFSVVNYGCFEGMLISREVVEKIGYPNREFFLAGDDAYYGYKASKYTNVIYTNEAVFIKKIKKNSKSENYLFYVNRNFTYFLLEITSWKTFTFLYRFAVAVQQSLRYKSFAPIKGFVQGVRKNLDLPAY